MKIGRFEINIKWHKRVKKKNSKKVLYFKKVDKNESRIKEITKEINWLYDDTIHNMKIDIKELKNVVSEQTKILEKIIK